MQPPTIPIIDFEREEVEDARRQNFAQKFVAGAELFDYACAITKAGIRWQNPDFNDEQTLAELRRRISLGEALERHSW
jgi:hypothetical protein